MSVKKDLIGIGELYSRASELDGKEIKTAGWIRSVRASNAFAFVVLNDGTCFDSLQVVLEEGSLSNYNDITALNAGAAIMVRGAVVLTPGAKQPFELKASEVEICGESAPDYPLQPKRHTMEFLRTISHLRPRTNTFNAVFRIRSTAAQAIHSFFAEKGYLYIQTPIITSSDAEGAGEMFQVTTLPLDEIPIKEGKADYSEDFFGKKTHLTVSGQLNVECFAASMSNVYTFGPTFRAEVSNTPRHAAEFWMIEPEIAFADLDDDMDLAEEMMKYVVSYVMEKCMPELEFCDQFIEKGLVGRLENLVKNEFERITYTEAMDILSKSGQDFQYKPEWGISLQSEHEKYLAGQVYGKPVFVYNYPKEIKSFYMRLNDDMKTVAATDMLVPGIGELIGGSQREERLDVLLSRIKELGLSEEDYWWYIELRKYGTMKHAGFGIGFERLIMYLTGVKNIRDVQAFTRTTGSISY